jgi:predicted RNA-binding protein YlqC (UPF0109 family)
MNSGGFPRGMISVGERTAVHNEPWLASACYSGQAIGTMQAVTDRLKNFLQYIAVNLIDEPGQAQLKVAELGPKRLRFKLVLAKPDVAMLIGRNGFTASAIRSVLKAAAEREGVQVSLQIHSHEEEAELLARGDGQRGDGH